MTQKASKILDSNGRPYSAGSDPTKPGSPAADLAEYMANGGAGASNFMAHLAKLRRTASRLAADPFSHHPYVYAPVTTIDAAASKAPMRVFMETKEMVAARAEMARAQGRTFVPRRGRHRAAIRRHVEGPLMARITHYGVEPVFDHPVADLLAAPNAHQDQAAFFSSIYQNAVIDGSVYVRLAGKDEESLTAGDEVGEMYVLRRGTVSPILEYGQKGRPIGYKYVPPYYHPRAREKEILCSLNEIVPIRFPHPSDQLDGWSRVVAALGAVEHDFELWRYLRQIVSNPTVGSGVINMDGPPPTQEEAAELRAKFEELNAGSAGRMNFVWGGKYQPSGFSPTDAGVADQQRANRDLIFAPMGVPPSALGMTEFQNYATKLAQLKFFWDVSVLPILNRVAAAFDRSMLFYTEPDTIYIDYDLSQIEPLRAGLSDKIDIAAKLMSPAFHMDPVTAAKAASLDLPRYEGDTVAIIPASFVQAAEVVSNLGIKGDPSPEPDDEDAEDDEPTDDDPDPFAPIDEDDDPPSAAAPSRRHGPRRVIAASKRERAQRTQRRLQGARDPIESKIRRAYRDWVSGVADETIKRFDKASKKAAAGGLVYLGSRRVSAGFDLTLWIPELKTTSTGAAKSIHTSLAAGLDAVYAATLEEIGIPTFEIDDNRFVEYWRNYERQYGNKTASGLIKRLEQQHRAALSAGETVSELRTRLIDVFEGASRSAKALQVARTTAGSFMNGEREEMFVAAGIETLLWTTAEDEVVRTDHQLFADSGEQKTGFDYQSIAQKITGGTMEFPGDPRAPYGQIASCRCALVVA